MLRAWMEGVKLKSSKTLLLAILLVLVGCYWSRYPELMETHLVLLDQFSAKLDSVARTDGGVRMEDWAEYVYPLERAQDFARIVAERYPDRPSLREFRIVLERYGALVDDPGLLLRPDAARLIEQRRVGLEAAIAATRVELKREAGA